MSESDAESLPIGTLVQSRYQISAVVGRGGLGTVYQVVDVLFSKHNIFALKELTDQSSGARKQFELESQWLQSLDHNNIPKVREHFEWQQRLYLVMDFVEGENLEQKLTRLGGRPLPVRQVVQWILPICDALQYLHTRMPPILHRDVKPANIIVTHADHPVLVDLGIAKEHVPGAQMTATFVRKAGTEGYAPPEQYSTAGQTGPWSDVYGLGATVYHLLTGQIPPTVVERVALDTALIPPRIINSGVNPRTDALVVRALALRPSDRFQSISEFKHALLQAIETPMSTSLPHTPQSSLAPVHPYPQPSAGQVHEPQFIRQNVRPFKELSAPHAAVRQGVAVPPPPQSSLPTPGVSPASMPPPGPSTPTHMSQASWQTGNLGSSQPGASSGRLPAITLSNMESVGQVVTTSPHNRISAPPRSSHAPWLAIIACCLVLAGATAAYMVIRASAPPDRSSANATVNGYFASLHDQDYARAWLFVSASRNDVSTQDQLTAELRADDARFGSVLRMTIANTETDGTSKVTVQVHVVRARSPDTVMNYTVVVTQYDGSTWLIDSITLA